MTHTEIRRKIHERLVVDLAECGTVEQGASMEGRQITMVIAPKKK